MKVLVIGATGFVGRSVCSYLSHDDDIEVIGADRKGVTDYALDLMKPELISEVLKDVQPDAVINCAGVISRSEEARLNYVMTDNLLSAVRAHEGKIETAIVMGSAAEYGKISPCNRPVSEDDVANPGNLYGEAKAEETKVVTKHRNEGLNAVILRIFNPVGKGLPEQQIIPKLSQQIESYKKDKQKKVEAFRLDSTRDYFNVKNLGSAISAIIKKGETEHVVYNVGSGEVTENRQLLSLLLDKFKVTEPFDEVVSEKSDKPEPCFAANADTKRLQEEFGWKPEYTLKDAIEEL